MLRGSWHDTDTPHSAQYTLLSLVFFGILTDLVALALVGVAWWRGDGTGGVFYFLAQWCAAMTPFSVGYWLWLDRVPLWRQIQARLKRQALRRSEYDI